MALNSWNNPGDEKKFPSMTDILKCTPESPQAAMNIVRTTMRHMQPRSQITPVVDEMGNTINIETTRNGLGPIKNQFGRFWHMPYDLGDQWGKYHALVSCSDIDPDSGNPIFQKPDQIIVRTDSGCLTGQLFHDSECDCREQLDSAMGEIGKAEGVIIHIPGQDGRGMGLAFKLATLDIQERLGVDNVRAACLLRFMQETQANVTTLMQYGEWNEAQQQLDAAIIAEAQAERIWDAGNLDEAIETLERATGVLATLVEEVRGKLGIRDIDRRTYEGVIAVLRAMGISHATRIDLNTNNPLKEAVFERNDYPFITHPSIAKNVGHIRDHLVAKGEFLGHKNLLNGNGEEHHH